MIAEKDKARGRPLTPTEQLNHLEDALGMDEADSEPEPTHWIELPATIETVT